MNFCGCESVRGLCREQNEIEKSFRVVLRPLPERDGASGPGGKRNGKVEQTVEAIAGKLREAAERNEGQLRAPDARAAGANRSAQKTNRECDQRAGRRGPKQPGHAGAAIEGIEEKSRRGRQGADESPAT